MPMYQPQIIYGIKVLPAGDPYIKLAEDALAAVGSIPANPGSYLVDTVPICACNRFLRSDGHPHANQ
jgi:hypothetical protein